MNLNNPDGRPTEFVIRKSNHQREVSLHKAYETIKMYRDNLERLIKVDITMYPHQKMRLRHEVTRMTEWLQEKEKIMRYEFKQLV